jgi:16S rRNA (cytosine967-C5)-methyltransferase
VRAPKGEADVLADLKGRRHLVLIDAPCTGSGAWRRNPDAKWRIRPGALEQRIKDQEETLESALRFVKQGGRIVYITCSVLKAENEDRIAAFLERHDDLLPIDANAQANSAGLPALAEHRSTLGAGLRLSPRATGTDGFYIATLMRT